MLTSFGYGELFLHFDSARKRSFEMISISRVCCVVCVVDKNKPAVLLLFNKKHHQEKICIGAPLTTWT